MERKKFNFEEVVSYLESKIEIDIETPEELEAYGKWKWDGKFSKNMYKKLLKEMYKEYRGE